MGISAKNRHAFVDQGIVGWWCPESDTVQLSRNLEASYL
jgi:hypothetical protein